MRPTSHRCFGNFRCCCWHWCCNKRVTITRQQRIVSSSGNPRWKPLLRQHPKTRMTCPHHTNDPRQPLPHGRRPLFGLPFGIFPFESNSPCWMFWSWVEMEQDNTQFQNNLATPPRKSFITGDESISSIRRETHRTATPQSLQTRLVWLLRESSLAGKCPTSAGPKPTHYSTQKELGVHLRHDSDSSVSRMKPRMPHSNTIVYGAIQFFSPKLIFNESKFCHYKANPSFSSGLVVKSCEAFDSVEHCRWCCCWGFRSIVACIKNYCFSIERRRLRKCWRSLSRLYHRSRTSEV